IDGILFGVYRPHGILDAGREHGALVGRRIVRTRRRTADCAGIYAERSVQRTGGDSGGTSTGDARGLWRNPQSELSRIAHLFPGMGAVISQWRGCSAGSDLINAAAGANSRRGTAAA